MVQPHPELTTEPKLRGFKSLPEELISAIARELQPLHSGDDPRIHGNPMSTADIEAFCRVDDQFVRIGCATLYKNVDLTGNAIDGPLCLMRTLLDSQDLRQHPTSLVLPGPYVLQEGDKMVLFNTTDKPSVLSAEGLKSSAVPPPMDETVGVVLLKDYMSMIP
jgi:hypothetical protein